MRVKILVAEDSTVERTIIKDMLSDYQVLTACDGVEAMHVLNEHNDVDILILDLNMPRMDGFQVLEALRCDRRFKNLRTIILTNYDELENEIRGLRLGAVDFIRKPIHMHSLKARIDVHVTLLRAQQALEQRLDEQTLTFDMIFTQAPIGIAISHELKGHDKPVIKVNPMFEQIVGRTEEEINIIGWEKITHPDDLGEDAENLKKLRAGEIGMYCMDKRYIRPDGSVVWVHMIVAPLILPEDRIFGHICLVQDITDRKIFEEALHESERSKSVFLSHLPGLAYRCNYDREWTMQFVSDGCYALTGYRPESLLNNRELSFKDIISPEYREALWNKWKEVLAQRQQFKYEYEIITATGERKWVLELGQGIFNDNGEVEALEGIILDISDRKAVEDALKYNNEHDRTTGLYNREYLISLLENDLKKKKDIKKALIGVNLTAVQLLTVKYGFNYTQSLIKKAAAVLSALCSENRQLFHVRENRFVFYIVGYSDKNELVEFGNAVAETLESLFITDRINGGIGIVEIDQHQSEINAELLMRRMLLATDRSINLYDNDYVICFYDDELESMVNREIEIERALFAIANDTGTKDELFLHYQPILDLKSGSICDFEALCRLKTEKLGLVSPAEFIPVAEKTKLIIPIGEKVIINAFKFLSRLNENGYGNISVSVNISVIQLLKPEFTDRLLELIAKMNVNPGNICLEITESVFSSDFARINKAINKLRTAGIHIAIDDFGTGYSSLAREKELNVDSLKIDKYFIDNLLDANPDKVITSDIISMSHKLGHCTVAEGVEHDIQLHYLMEHDCDRVQGYLISKPLDENNAIEFLKNYSA
ncbi:response regulator receiver modulated diguanylate cyclase/phosphodiesterase with PAS/PAC sensor(S) [Thermoclostridium stercorarium subsp. stercorarium DSM 8532]|uniref:Stage 0 sporulation protein A homolog n=1 Tax=Thermoclostridium stercorarium (strain ATCC 35414 / DSM 8532 / NCIMB 11754) TaxID=1121335 RepID=L7VN44_THES1|nr:EAL domain-containing protein [Thermoclostridium stercorarium]AGC67901.1 response regulator receiver modulated diguanylate cyclase/phosphodiesterase with PAS/PAC sensor(S) [Thermoclostridium stercorarium subsp. stercorarium DSM 8532]AGI38942.1 response regulator [Thermoclostridium stercorarium subsp. stercorarium DSM 8532]